MSSHVCFALRPHKEYLLLVRRGGSAGVGGGGGLPWVTLGNVRRFLFHLGCFFMRFFNLVLEGYVLAHVQFLGAFWGPKGLNPRVA